MMGFVTQKSYGSNTSVNLIFSKLKLYRNPINYSALLKKQGLKQYWQNFQFRLNLDPRLADDKRKKVVVLGTGWGAIKFIRYIDISLYDITIVSPRDYFSFTPLLPSACVGTLSPRACLEPVRNLLTRGGKLVMNYHEGYATDVNFHNKEVDCQGVNGNKFSILYDYLVLAVGSDSNTFGIPGVKENAYFLKAVEDAKKLHSRILDNLEQANLPNLSENEIRQLLHFVVVGGGLTGVEVAAEIADFIKEDVAYYFPKLIQYTKISLVEMLPNVLPQFAQHVSLYAKSNLEKLGISVLNETQVTKVTTSTIVLKDTKKNESVEVPYGFVLWASGVSQVPFVKHVLTKIPSQAKNKAIRVNEKLQVLGVSNMYGIGDCSLVTPEPLSNHTDLFYEWLVSSKKNLAYWLKANVKCLSSRFPQIDVSSTQFEEDNTEELTDKQKLGIVLKKLDETYKPPPQTAQNASQEARYLAATFNNYITPEEKNNAPAFNYYWRGSMAYIGLGNSIIVSPRKDILGGRLSHFLWRGFYFSQQLSRTNQILCLLSWFRTKFFGRDVARDHSLWQESKSINETRTSSDN